MRWSCFWWIEKKELKPQQSGIFNLTLGMRNEKWGSGLQGTPVIQEVNFNGLGNLFPSKELTEGVDFFVAGKHR